MRKINIHQRIELRSAGAESLGQAEGSIPYKQYTYNL
jgi:hypothetical protein